MMTDAVHASLALLFAELIDGPAADASYMLNGGDPGLLRSLDRLSAESASKLSPAEARRSPRTSITCATG